MSADIIILPIVRAERGDPAKAGNGAREALTEIGKSCPFHVGDDLASSWSDDVLLHLAARGFIVVPMPDAERT